MLLYTYSFPTLTEQPPPIGPSATFKIHTTLHVIENQIIKLKARLMIEYPCHTLAPIGILTISHFVYLYKLVE